MNVPEALALSLGLLFINILHFRVLQGGVSVCAFVDFAVTCSSISQASSALFVRLINHESYEIYLLKMKVFVHIAVEL